AGDGRRGCREPPELRPGAADLRHGAIAADAVAVDAGPGRQGPRRRLRSARAHRARPARCAAGARGAGGRRCHGAGDGGLRAARLGRSRQHRRAAGAASRRSVAGCRAGRVFVENDARRRGRGAPGCGIPPGSGGRARAADTLGNGRPMLTPIWQAALMAFSLAVAAYFVLFNGSQILMGLVSGLFIGNYVRTRTRRDVALTARVAAAPFVSVIVPAHNEALTIVESVRALLALDYEPREIVVVNDGSSDDTLVVLQGAFHLLAAPVAFAQPLPSETVRGIYRSMDEPALVVIDKANGGKADAINAGINAAAGALVLTIDADTIIDPAALRRAVLPFLEDPATVGVGGYIAIANGCRMQSGRITAVMLPRSWLARFQVVEYM